MEQHKQHNYSNIFNEETSSKAIPSVLIEDFLNSEDCGKTDFSKAFCFEHLNDVNLIEKYKNIL